ncbi:hypothetical protein TTHT_1731 [Thermotomaculum hydrothermale]|uniref:Histidine kinase/HSP90-like ATPase domain-containing protein n=1 Tax=Thermotomaculum hydrothermale TaxID=981385 RepID=A0A7R6PP22_9BACT|nr:ATP-binding protein [Thermotomaculum hydrothermale]BBB33203.1 hypothetical protein TTHT_1731 [Thermotomaculum hydrothermale]
MSDFPKDVIISIEEERYWEGLGRQEMDFHQVIGELIDNSISASGKDSEGDLLPFKIEITLEKLGNKILVTVADEGIGMTVDEITEHIFSLGGKGRSEGPLNEHGFGLKNALCVLTIGNKLPWTLKTRDDEAVNQKLVYLVKGPFSSQMKLELDDITLWNKGLAHVKLDRGTRVVAETSFEFFNTLYPRARTFETLVERFIEHLGVMYRGFLNNEHNKLWLRWRILGDDERNPNNNAEWEEFRIKPIKIPYDAGGSQSTEFEVEGPEGCARAIYVRGNLDTEKVRDVSQGKPYPLKIYYQGNIPTQGIDIVVRGRVLKAGQLPEIWPDIPRHNNFNKFVGELILNDSKFRTVNNKISLNPHNPYWIRLLEKLDADDYKPQRITGAKIERDLSKKLKIMLEGHCTNSTVQRDKPIWSGAGVKVDIYHELNDGGIHIYELKAGTAAPLDAYQLLMYWDGVVKDEGKSPKVARLVAKEIPRSVENIIVEINKRKDSLGNNYQLEGKTIEELGL